MFHASSMELKNPKYVKIYRSSSTSAISTSLDLEINIKPEKIPNNYAVEKTPLRTIWQNDFRGRNIAVDGRKRSQSASIPNIPPEKMNTRKGLKFKTPISTRFNFLSPHSIPIQNERNQKSALKFCKTSKMIKFYSPESVQQTNGILKVADVDLPTLFYAPFMKQVSESEKKFHLILRAIKTNECKLVKALIKKKFIAMSEIRKRDSLIHEAAYKGCLKCTKLLIKNGSSVHSNDDEGFSPVHAAVIGKSFEVLNHLLESGASANCVSNTGWSAMHLVITMSKDNSMPSLKMLDALTKHGGNPFVKTNLNVTPFQLCIDLKRTLLLDYYICSSAGIVGKNC